MLQREELLKAGNLLSIEQSAKIFGVSPSTVRSWIQEKKLSSIRILGGLVRIEKSELIRILASGYRCRQL
jgi:excisionase family DNA binding protein